MKYIAGKKSVLEQELEQQMKMNHGKTWNKQKGISDLYLVDWSDKMTETENGRMNSGYEYASKCKKH